MRDDDLTTFNSGEGDPPSPEFVSALLERLDVAWHSRPDGHGYAEAIAGAGSSIASTNEYMGEPTMIDLETETTEQIQTAERSRWRPTAPIVKWAAALVLVVGVVGAVLSATRSDPPTTITGSSADAFTGDEALAVSGDFIEEFNSGDADAVLALLTPDVALSEKYTGPTSAFFEAIDRAFFEQHVAWATALGTTFTSPECAVTDDRSPAEVNVLCEFGWLYPAEKAAGAPPVPTTLTLVVTPDGLSQLAFDYPPIFGVESFDVWLQVNHEGDSQGVEYGDWNSVAEAQQGGTLRAQYVAEWAADLEANSG